VKNLNLTPRKAELSLGFARFIHLAALKLSQKVALSINIKYSNSPEWLHAPRLFINIKERFQKISQYVLAVDEKGRGDTNIKLL